MGRIANVPVIMQMEAVECGAACLDMILAYYQKWVPLERVREDCGVSRDGSVARNMLIAARLYGLEAKGYKFELEEIMRISYPCIVHWNFNHYVVLCGFRPNGDAVINDPARGRVEVSADEFDRSFTGVALLFKPSAQFTTSGKPRSVTRFLRERLRGMSSTLFIVMGIGLVSTLVAIANPIFGRYFIDSVLSTGTPRNLVSLLGMMAVTLLIYIVVSLLNAIYLLRIRGKMAITANSDFFWHLIRLPIGFFSQRYAGDILNRQESNENISKTAIERLAPMCINVVMLIFFLAIMIKGSWILALVSLGGVLVNVWLFRKISDLRLNLLRRRMREEGILGSLTTSGIEMIETLKASGVEDGFFSRWAGLHTNVGNAKTLTQRLDLTVGALPSLVQLLVNGAILILGVWLIMHDQFTVGGLLAFQSFAASLSTPFLELSSLGQEIQEMRGEVERIEDVMSYAPDVHCDDLPATDYAEPLTKLGGVVEIKHITFGYNHLSEPLIRDFSVSVPQGRRLAIVGSSGCGKSTLAKLIGGLYRPWEGEICIDGKSLGEIRHEVFTGSVGVVDQDTTLFEATIADNIRIWDTSIENFEIILAAKDAQMHDEILACENGYQTRLTEGGKNLSGGQRQRLEIARALAQDPTVLILDEATSNLDAVTERKIIDAIRDRGMTCIIVAHRLSTIRDCDQILVMEKGRIVEQGRHEELYARGGLYTTLITNQ